MKRTSLLGGAILVGLLTVSLALYWAADTGSATLQAVLLAVLGVISLASVWLWR
jgi:hypothetical protein